MICTDPRKNAEGYNDPTAYYGLKPVVAEDDVLQRRVNRLIYVLKYIIDTSGFELIGRIEVKDKKTGKVFR